MSTRNQVLAILDEALSLHGRALAFTDDTLLVGAIPELDSMAVVTIITSIEERLGITIDDDDLSGATFATVGSLVALVTEKTAA